MELDDHQQQIGINTSSAKNSKYPFLWFLLHGDTVGNDEATAIVEQSGSTDILAAGKIDLTGTTGAIWSTTAGAFSSPAGDVNGKDTTEDLRAFCDLSTITTGGILILLEKYYTANPSTTEYILDASSIHGADGGWEIDLATSGFLFLKIKPPADSLVNVARDTTAQTTSTWATYAVYIDVTNDVGIIMRDTIQQSSLIELPALPSGNVAAGVSFFARTDGAFDFNGGNSGGKLRNLQIYRVNEDIAGLIPTISSQYMATPHEVPSALRAE